MIPTHLAQLDLPDLRPLLRDPPPGLDLTWAYDWPAGLRLAEDLPNVAEVRGLRVLDLGCGRGRLGLCALVLGASEVGFADGGSLAEGEFFTDIETSSGPLAHVAEVLRRNHLDDRGVCHPHRWGDPLPSTRDGRLWDLILGGDILYRPGEFTNLATSLASGLTEGASNHALFSDPRQTIEPEWFNALTVRGLTWTSERREAGFTMLTIRRT